MIVYGYAYYYGMPSSFDFGSATPCLDNLVFWSDGLTDDILTDQSGEGNDCAVIQSNCLYFDGTAKIDYQLDDILIHYVDTVEINYSTDNVNWQVADLNWQYFEIDYINYKITIGEGFTGWISTHEIKAMFGDIEESYFISSPVAEGVGSIAINRAEEYDDTKQFYKGYLRSNVILQDNKIW